ncbi:zinc transporter ZIP1-like isoform X2 [Melanaphis sacchari]|uniref:zinc transporter ZIP1-like isoform X2 n=1 Tax=Melanaphis sacchari TaxID=742174 RepID=UPI000DC14B22|nr:zinc transporter ZIP1-like isoform X2 [Melanaphis sacchari]
MAAAEAAETDENPSSVVLAKVLAMAFLGVSSFVAGSTPVCVFERLGIRRRARGAANTALRLILNFGGGVLLCTTFLHLLPEVREGVEQLTADETLDPKSPWSGLLAELIMCSGFFFMYSIEELVHGFTGGDCHPHHSGSGQSTTDRGRGDDDVAAAAPPQQRRGDASAAVGQSNAVGCEKTDAAPGRVVNYNSCMSSVELAAAVKKPVPAAAPASESVVRGFLVIGALSIHELFEGLAVGLEKTSTQVRRTCPIESYPRGFHPIYVYRTPISSRVSQPRTIIRFAVYPVFRRHCQLQSCLVTYCGRCMP